MLPRRICTRCSGDGHLHAPEKTGRALGVGDVGAGTLGVVVELGVGNEKALVRANDHPRRVVAVGRCFCYDIQIGNRDTGTPDSIGRAEILRSRASIIPDLVYALSITINWKRRIDPVHTVVRRRIIFSTEEEPLAKGRCLPVP